MPHAFAMIEAGLGEREEALGWLEKALRIGSPW